MDKKIIIIGGGISGLSCAFDLNKKGFKVEIYERNNVFGGQSRSVN
jgi:phytoene dehydrogenase-like protein